MIKRLYLSLMLGATTALVVGCSGGGGGFDPVPVPIVDPQPQPQPDPCAAQPVPASCIQDKVSITSPAANSLWSKPEMSIVAKFTGGVPSGLTLKLNGADVASYAAFDATSATIAGTAIESFLVNGENVFETTAGAETDKVAFLYDIRNPHIIVTSAVQSTTGAVQQNPGDTLKVSGVVRDVASITSVKINDFPAAVNGHDFTVEIPYNDIYRISATDASGQSGSLDFAAPQHVNDPMLTLQLNESIFGVIQPIVDGVIADFDTTALVDPTQRIPFLGNQLAVTRLDIDKGGEPAIDMHFVPSAGDALVVEVGVKLPLAGMGLQLYSANGVNPMLAIDIDIANVDLTLQLAVSSNDLNQLKLGLGSETPFDLTFGNIAVNRLDLLCNDQQCVSLGEKIGPLLNNAVFRTVLTNLINNNIVPGLATALADAKFPNQPLNAPLDLNGDGVRDSLLSIDLAPSRFATDAQGNGQIELAGRMSVPNDQLPDKFKGALGSVYVDASVVPTFASTTAAGKAYDLGIALPSNFLNQAFLSFYQSGVMSSLSAELAPDALGSFATFLGNPDKLLMQLEFGSVPYMQLSHAGLADGRTSGIAMHLDNVTIRISSKKGNADFAVVIGMVADITANLELGIDGNNYINLGVENLVDMDVVSVLKEGFNASGGLPASLIESQIAPAVRGMLKTDTLPAMLKKTMEIAISMADKSDVPLQLPLEMGMIFRELSVDAHDAYLVVKLDLLYSEEVKNSTENLSYRINIGKRPPVTPAP